MVSTLHKALLLSFQWLPAIFDRTLVLFFFRALLFRPRSRQDQQYLKLFRVLFFPFRCLAPLKSTFESPTLLSFSLIFTLPSLFFIDFLNYLLHKCLLLLSSSSLWPRPNKTWTRAIYKESYFSLSREKVELYEVIVHVMCRHGM